MELIDRNEVRYIESDKDAYNEDWNDEYERGFCDAINKVLELHTIEAEPVRHGRWKKKNGEIYCTNCKKSKWSESFELMLRRFNFCPNCGADMIEEGADNG